MQTYGVEDIVWRVRFFDKDSGGKSTPIDWRWAAIILATVFLNFSFFEVHGLDVAGFGSLAVDATVLCVAAVLITLLFFIGPALAVRATQRPVLSLLEDSIGTIPTLAVRFCCVLFLFLWIARLLAVPTLWALSMSRGEGCFKTGIIAVALLLFLFFTGLQSVRTSAKLAMFTDKLGIAILIAALIRVRDGWASVPGGFGIAGLYPHALQFTSGLSNIASYAAPFGLFAAEYASRIPSRKQVSLTILSGVTVPMFLALFLSSIVGMATAVSHLYQPSLNATVAMALWAHTAGAASPSRILVAGITTFGALRFGIRALAEYGPAISNGTSSCVAHVCAVVAIATLALRPYATASIVVSDICVRCIAVAGAVLTASVVMGLRSGPARRRFDTVGLIALLAGAVTALCLPEQFLWAQGRWWLPWLLPTYAVGFLVFFVGRSVQRQSRRK
jgi:hypothetical protein